MQVVQKRPIFHKGKMIINKKKVIRSLKKEGYCQNDISHHLFNVIVLTKLTFYGLSVYAASKSELTTVQKFVCLCYKRKYIPYLIIKITISSIVIGLKTSYFPLIHLPSCYRTVQQTNQIQSCSLNQPITFKVVV